MRSGRQDIIYDDNQVGFGHCQTLDGFVRSFNVVRSGSDRDLMECFSAMFLYDDLLIFEEPAWECRNPNPISGVCAQHARIYWTDQSVLDKQPVPTLSDTYYYYVNSIMIHEFGHTFGLPDFGADLTTGLQGLPAVMDDPRTHKTPTIEDIAQLRAIYALHEPTDHDP